MTKDTFSNYHPIINFLYFFAVIGFGMFFVHPVNLAISFFCGALYSYYLHGKKALLVGVLFMLPLLLFATLMNPLFNHAGATILAYLPNGNPVTLESILFGLSAGLMLITIIAWFTCFSVVINSDKVVYLFGRIIPVLSLIFSMALRFVPLFKAQLKVIASAQRCIGRDIGTGSILQRAKHGIKILSIMVTWALENAIETADSMKARGYGLPGRSTFSIFTFQKRDGHAFLYIFACSAAIIAGAVTEVTRFRYFPTIRGHWSGIWTILAFATHFALCIMPIVLNLREDLIWRNIEGQIEGQKLVNN